jgi:hypothetical protein
LIYWMQKYPSALHLDDHPIYINLIILPSK